MRTGFEINFLAKIVFKFVIKFVIRFTFRIVNDVARMQITLY